MFKAILKFPKDYPGLKLFFKFLDNPPVMKFITPIWVSLFKINQKHPNVYKGKFFFLLFQMEKYV